MEPKVYIANDSSADIGTIVSSMKAELVRLQDLAQHITADPNCRGVVLVPRLGRQLNGAIDIQLVLDAWLGQAQTVLSILRRNRRTVLLLDLHDALEAPDHAAAIVNAWRVGNPDPPLLKRPAQPASLIDELADLAGPALIADRSEAAVLYEEIGAATAPIFELEAKGARTHYHRALEQAQRLQAKEAASMKEAATLREALILSSENYSSVVIDAETTEAEVKQLREAVALAAENYAAASNDADQRQNNVRNAERARSAVEANLEAYRKRETKMKNEIEALKSTVISMRKELVALKDHEARVMEALEATRSSASWKVTAPMRAVRAALNGTPKGSEPKK